MKYDHFHQSRKQRWEELWVYRSYEDEHHNLPLYVLHAGYGSWQPGASYQRTDSEVFSIEYVVRGVIELTQRGRISIIGPGQIFLLHRGISHEYRSLGPDVALKRYACLDGPILEHLLHLLNVSGRDHVTPDDPQAMQAMFRRIPQLLSKSALAPAQQAAALAYDLLQRIAGSSRAAYPGPLESAVNYMYSHLDQRLRVTDLAQAAGLSEPYLNRLFNRHVHTSPMSFFINQKLAWAAHLLRYTTLSIKEIAFKTGYQDPLYFSSQFRQHTGVSPRKYRQGAKQHPEMPQL